MRVASVKICRCMLISIIFGSIFVLIIFAHLSKLLFDIKNAKSQLMFNTEEKYTIKTNGCHIPAMRPINSLIKEFIFEPDVKPCRNAKFSLVTHNNSFFTINEDPVVLHHYNIVDSTLLSCCYSPFYRPNYIENIESNSVDDRIEYEKISVFNKSIEIWDEFVRIYCSYEKERIYEQYFIFVALKERTTNEGDEKKMDNRTGETGYNVLVIGLDNVSRLNFHRTMPKTVAFMQRREAIEFIGYNKVGDNSYPNLVPLLMGYAADEIKEICHPMKKTTYDDCPFLWHWYRDAGYYTALGEDSGFLGTFNYQEKGFRKTPTDYYLRPFIREAEKNTGNNKDGNVNLCMGEVYLYKVLLDYIEALTITLSQEKLFGFFWETTISHDFLNYPRVMDDSYEEFFVNLEESNYLDNTIIFLVSDHGIRWGEFRRTKQGYLEERLPLLYVLTPPSFKETYSEAFDNLKYNSRQLTTPFDLHETLRDLIRLESISNNQIQTRNHASNERGVSLFSKISENRTCKAAGIDDQFCTCHDHVPMSTRSEIALNVSNVLMEYLNSIVLQYSQCVELKLDTVLDAEEVIGGHTKSLSANWREFSVVVSVCPSGGVFEGTVRHEKGRWRVVGTVSRLNLYGSQSHCVSDPRLKLYCYCAKQSMKFSETDNTTKYLV